MQRNKAASSMADPFDGDLDVPDYDEIERELFESEDDDEPVDREPAVDKEPEPPAEPAANAADDVECVTSSEPENVQLVCMLFDDKLICESVLLPCPSNNILHRCGVPMRPVTMTTAEQLEELLGSPICDFVCFHVAFMCILLRSSRLRKLSETWGDLRRFTPSEVGDLMDASDPRKECFGCNLIHWNILCGMLYRAACCYRPSSSSTAKPKPSMRAPPRPKPTVQWLALRFE